MQRAFGRLESKVDMMLDRQGEQHEDNTKRWEAVKDYIPLTEAHEEWINKFGQPTVDIVRDGKNAVKYGGRGMIFGIALGSSAIGGLIVKIASMWPTTGN